MGYGEPGAWFSNVYTASGDEALAAAAFYTTGEKIIMIFLSSGILQTANPLIQWNM